MRKHEDRCSFITFECPQVNCGANLIIAEVVDHIKNVHGGRYNTNFKDAISWLLPRGEEMFRSDMTWQPSITIFDGHTFLLNACVKDLNMIGWAVVIGDKKIAKKYEVSIKAKGYAAEVSVWGDVYSLDIAPKDILDDWKGVLEISKNMARKLARVRTDGRQDIRVKYELRRK